MGVNFFEGAEDVVAGWGIGLEYEVFLGKGRLDNLVGNQNAGGVCQTCTYDTL